MSCAYGCWNFWVLGCSFDVDVGTTKIDVDTTYVCGDAICISLKVVLGHV